MGKNLLPMLVPVAGVLLLAPALKAALLRDFGSYQWQM
mgnify:CR=1 FL=1